MGSRPMLERLSSGLLRRLAASQLRAIVKVEIRGEDAGSWYVRVGGDSPEIVAALDNGEHPDVIVSADANSLDALLAGRMTFSDGAVSERLSVAGDVAKIVAFKDAVTGER